MPGPDICSPDCKADNASSANGWILALWSKANTTAKLAEQEREWMSTG